MEELTVTGPSRTDAQQTVAPATYSGLSVLGLILFLLPWVNISCNNEGMNRKQPEPGKQVVFKEPAFTQTGVQIITGRLQENPRFKDELKSKFDPLRTTAAQASQSKQAAESISDRSGPAAQWLLAFPCCLLVIAVCGLLRMGERRHFGSPIVAAAALAAAGVMATTAFVQFPVEKDIAFSNANDEQRVGVDGMAMMDLDLFVAERTAIYWGEVVIAGVILLLVLYDLSTARAAPTRPLREPLPGGGDL